MKIQDAQEGTKGSRNMAIMSKFSTSNTCEVTGRLAAWFKEDCGHAQHGFRREFTVTRLLTFTDLSLDMLTSRVPSALRQSPAQ